MKYIEVEGGVSIKEVTILALQMEADDEEQVCISAKP